MQAGQGRSAQDVAGGNGRQDQLLMVRSSLSASTAEEG